MPVDKKIFFACFAIDLSKRKFVISPEAILILNILRLKRKFKLSRSNGLDKKEIFSLKS